ncbi:MAG TPA: tripartite tricarboxylate transporter substrate binding protein [Caldimonas sp.]
MQRTPSRETRRRALRSLAAALGLTLVSPLLLAQAAWPSKPVTLIVPFAPGGSTDVVARMLGQKLGEMWHQTVIIDNRAGAGGNIGAALVAKAAPDGYTLLMASGSILTVNPHLYQKLPFDAKKDFVPITNVASGPMVVLVPMASEVKTLKELVAKAKAEPGRVTFGSAGQGSQVHMAAEKLADAAGLDLQHIPYKGEALAYSDLMSGQIQMVVGNIGAALSLVTDGRLRALAVTGRERSKMMPDVPTVMESGIAYENSGWFGLLAPAGTPKEIVDQIQRATVQVLAQTEVKARLFTQGMTAVGNAPAEFGTAIEQESKSWAAIVKNRKLSTN